VASEMPLDPAQQMESAYLLGCVIEAQGRKDEAARIFGELAQKDLAYRDVEERYRRLRASKIGTSQPLKVAGHPRTIARS